jgi:5-oxoprolinase (ATP-hydrolysing)
MLRIHTVAAGGGSLCRFDGFTLTVGPESAGAEPGPLCYGRPGARALALTDVNLFLGRVRAERFPFALERGPVERALAEVSAALAAAGHARSPDETAAGFVEVANARMAQAIQEVSVRRGVDPREFALVAFGGAAGQHACAVAKRLGIRTILLHPLAGLLSAWGIGLAERSWDGQRDAGREPLARDGAGPPAALALLGALAEDGRRALAAEGLDPSAVRIARSLDLRYAGAETALAVAEPADGDWARA